MPESPVLSRLPVPRVLAALLSRGGEHAELFSEEVLSLTVLLDDSRIERVVSGEDSGIGLRLLFRGKTYYAYTNDRTAGALLSLAGDLSRYAEGEGFPADLPAAPAAVRGPAVVRVWLRGFAYRIDVPVWAFLAAGSLALAVAMGTIAWQAVKAAQTDPVETIRYE